NSLIVSFNSTYLSSLYQVKRFWSMGENAMNVIARRGMSTHVFAQGMPGTPPPDRVAWGAVGCRLRDPGASEGSFVCRAIGTPLPHRQLQRRCRGHERIDQQRLIPLCPAHSDRARR